MKRIAWVLAACSLLSVTRAEADTASIEALQREFRDYSGAELVFRESALPAGHYYEVMKVLSEQRREQAARIAVREVRKYPPGYLGAIRLERVGIFDGLASKTGDGYRGFDSALGGYRYYGLWNGRNALVAAYYSDGQLPLTLHHEIFHHVDATHVGIVSYARNFAADDARFARAASGAQRYAPIGLGEADRSALRARAHGYVLQDSVSAYAAKSPGEDQAETARQLMTTLPDALLQMATRPELAGSQRMLHVLRQYQRAAANGLSATYFVDVALGRRTQRAAQRNFQTMRGRLRPRGDFVVWGREDVFGINWTLRRDLWSFDQHARDVSLSVAATPWTLRSVRLLARYRRHISRRWALSAGTAQSFDWARAQMVTTVAGVALRARLQRVSWAALARDIDDAGRWIGRVAPSNQYMAKVNEAIDDVVMRSAIRAVQPATVRLDNGSGVNLSARGVIMTAAHVAPRLGMSKKVLFPDGRRFTATAAVVNRKLDVALLVIDSRPLNLPVAELALSAPRIGTVVVTIGQPGRYTPSGEPTHYKPFHVSVGHIRGFLPAPLGDQRLGRTKHDAWTYWGHSGAPLFDHSGHIVAMHNSWDSTTGMRHAVTWEALTKVLRDSRLL